MVLFEDGLEAGTLGVDIMSAPSVRTTPVVNLEPHVRSHSDLGVYLVWGRNGTFLPSRLVPAKQADQMVMLSSGQHLKATPWPLRCCGVRIELT